MSAHERALAFGGRPGIPNLGMVESAIQRPYSGYHRAMARKAAALVESMATNHGFADGNKRTTVILLHLLVRKSGYAIVPIFDMNSPSQEVESMVLDVVNHNLDYDGLVEWFRQRLYKLDR